MSAPSTRSPFQPLVLYSGCGLMSLVCFPLQQYQNQLFQQTEDVDGKTEIIIKVSWACLLGRVLCSLTRSTESGAFRKPSGISQSRTVLWPG